MKRMLFLAGLLVLFACSEETKKPDLSLLNGYWEIERVVFPNGSTKEYGLSTTIDYISLDSLTGFRKKVYPKLNGTFEVSDDATFFTIAKQNEIFSMHYGSEGNEWSEQLIFLDSSEHAVRNVENITYYYRRHQPLIELNDQKK